MSKCVVSMLAVFIFAVGGFAQTDSVANDDSTAIETAIDQLSNQLESLTEPDGSLPDELVVDGPFASVAIRSRLSQKMQSSKGFVEGRYRGSSLRSYQRILFEHGKTLSGSIVLEKDAGERRLNDFTSGYLMSKSLLPNTSIFVGDFIVEAGQGIALWRPVDYAKGSSSVGSMQRRGHGLRPVRSAMEYGFFRGGAMEFAISEFSGTAFYSSKNISASIDSLDRLTSFYRGGYFRTETEEQKRHSAREVVFGLRSTFRIAENLQIGGSWHQTRFSKPVLEKGEQHNKFSMTSVDYSFMFASTTFFGEWGRAHKAVAGVTGVLLQPGRSAGAAVVFRHYPQSFTSLHGLGFGEKISTSNERGVYVLFKLKPIRSFTIVSSIDHFSFPGSTTSAPFGIQGREYSVDADIHVSSRLDFSIQYLRKLIEERTASVNASGFSSLVTAMKQRDHLRCDVKYELSNAVKLQVQYARVTTGWQSSSGKEFGHLLFNDIVLKASEQLWWNFRVILFRTDSYDSRVVEFERDVPGGVSLPVLYGKGMRWYLLMRYQPSRLLSISAKYSEVVRDDVRHLGSGLDELPGNRDNRFGVQFDVQF